MFLHGNVRFGNADRQHVIRSCIVHQRKALVTCEVQRSRSSEHDVRCVLHDAARHADRADHIDNRCDGACLAARPMHDGRIEFDEASGIRCRAFARYIEATGFELGDRQFDNVQRRLTGRQASLALGC